VTVALPRLGDSRPCECDGRNAREEKCLSHGPPLLRLGTECSLTEMVTSGSGAFLTSRQIETDG
jgi:hypothetical protein